MTYRVLGTDMLAISVDLYMLIAGDNELIMYCQR